MVVHGRCQYFTATGLVHDVRAIWATHPSFREWGAWEGDLPRTVWLPPGMVGENERTKPQ